MAYSYETYTGDGSTTIFSIPFQYLDSSHVKVSVAGVSTPFTFINSGSLSITPAPASGATVRVYRETPKDSPPVDFVDGSVLKEADLDLLALTTFYISQEVWDANTLSVGSVTDVYDASVAIKNEILPARDQVVAAEALVLPARDTVVSAMDTVVTAEAIVVARADEVAVNTAIVVAKEATAHSYADSASQSANDALTASSTAQAYVGQAMGFTASSSYDFGSITDSVHVLSTDYGSII